MNDRIVVKLSACSITERMRHILWQILSLGNGYAIIIALAVRKPDCERNLSELAREEDVGET